MSGTTEKKLADLGIALPKLSAPIANYVGSVRSGNLLYVSGQLCLGADGKLVATGKLGAGVTVEAGQSAARACAIFSRSVISRAKQETESHHETTLGGGGSFCNPAATNMSRSLISSVSRNRIRPCLIAFDQIG